MEVEKRGVKGSFFQLFDWNGKSRKKLFSGKSESPESSNHVKENYHGSFITRRQQGLEKGYPSNDYKYASCASGDSEYGAKAPGVVARLMGLDSLPTSNANEPCYTPLVESHSYRDSSYLMAGEHDIVIFESVRNKLDGLSRNPLSRHLERFQTEVLPPKSAKPISITNHRLLSPIKSPGFIPPKNAAYIIEAAAKMIEQSPRSTAKANLGSSSVPFRVGDMKEKLEASQRTSRSADALQKSKDQTSINTKKQNNARGKSQSGDNYLYKGSEESKRTNSYRLKSKEKPVGKANIQKRDGLTCIGNKSFEKPKVHSDVKTRDVPITQKKLEKKSSSTKHSEVLRLNNQKQNCAFAEEEENLGPSCSHPKEKKESNLSTNYIHGRTNRTVNKVVVNNVVTSRKTNFVAADPGKELASSRAKTASKKKLPINGKTQSCESVAQKKVMTEDEKSVKCNIAFEDDSKGDGFDKKNSLDVVSFTFTSPIKKSGARSNSCGVFSEASSSSFPICREPDFTKLIGGDALSVLLEQKLKELTCKFEMSQKDLSDSHSANSYGSVNFVKSLPVDNDTCKSNEEILYNSDCPSIDIHVFKAGKEQKGLAYIERDGDKSNIEYQINLDLQGSISISSQLCLSGATSDRSSSNEGPFPCLSLGSYEGKNWGSTTLKSRPAEDDVEISDTATSTSETVNSSPSLSYMMDSKHSCSWELQYIGDILSSAELLFEEFALGQAHNIIPPDLFDQLESQRVDSFKHVLERKVLFDCVCECLKVKCGRLLAGSCEFFGVKQMMTFSTRQWLAGDLYREISSLRNVEELMVDELVDKDMSSKNGKWIDFQIEAFEQGVEIEKTILTCLVDELIDDFLF